MMRKMKFFLVIDNGNETKISITVHSVCLHPEKLTKHFSDLNDLFGDYNRYPLYVDFLCSCVHSISDQALCKLQYIVRSYF